MAFQGQQLYKDVLAGVEAWIPTKAYSHESKFQNELQEFLDEYLNDSGTGMLDVGMQSEERSIRRERGAARGDLVVNDTVGIEMKRDLTNNQVNTLRGQIGGYADAYSYVIVCACGIQDMGGWRELKNKFEGTYGDLMDQTQIAFVHKEKEHYGKEPRDVGGGDGLLGGGGLW